MTIVLHSEPATADDVAEILGVPKSRVKWLKRLVSARHEASPRIQARKATNGQARSIAAKGRKNGRGKAKRVAH